MAKKAKATKPARSGKPGRNKANRTAKTRVHKTLKSAAQVIRARVLRAEISLVTPKGMPPRLSTTRWHAEIKVGQRHRKDFGDLKDLAQSIDARGGLIQPIAITPDNVLIAGERRLKAWPLTKFKSEPIPVRVMTIDSIIAGEWDENAKRKDFTPSEAAAISDEIERQIGRLAEARMKAGKKADPAEKGVAADQAARVTGFSRRTIDKAKAVKKAAEEDPETFGKLKEDMDRTGRVDGPHKRLTVIKQTRALRESPPPLPMNGPYGCIVVDFPVTGDRDKDQETIDAQGRSFRGYPEMSIRECGRFAREQLLPILAPDCAVWLTFPNFHIVHGDAHAICQAFGADFKPATMLSWKKDRIGRGAILRDATEHAILIYRGKPTFNVLGEDPPTTFLDAPRRENSRKPDELYARIERVCPAPRYAEIFSRGGRSEKWDCHGDEVGKFAPAIARAAEAELMAEAKGSAPLAPSAAAEAALDADRQCERAALEAVAAGGVVEDADMRARLGKNKWIKGRKPKLTEAGIARLAYLKGQGVGHDVDGHDETVVVRRTLPGRDAALIAFAEQHGHVVAMTSDWQANGGDGESVGTCQCGWSHREPKHGKPGDASDPAILEKRIVASRAMDEAISAHWRDERDATDRGGAAYTEWCMLVRVVAGRDIPPGDAGALQSRGFIKRPLMASRFSLTPAGDLRLHELDKIFATQPTADETAAVPGAAERPGAASAPPAGPESGGAPATGLAGDRVVRGRSSASPASDDVDDQLAIPGFMRRDENNRLPLTTLVNPKHLPSAADVAAIADRAEARAK